MTSLKNYVGTYRGFRHAVNGEKSYGTEVVITHDSVTFRTARDGGFLTDTIPYGEFVRMTDEALQDDQYADAECEAGFEAVGSRTRLLFTDTSLPEPDVYGLVAVRGDATAGQIALLFTKEQIARGDMDRYATEVEEERPGSLVRLPE